MLLRGAITQGTMTRAVTLPSVFSRACAPCKPSRRFTLHLQDFTKRTKTKQRRRPLLVQSLKYRSRIDPKKLFNYLM